MGTTTRKSTARCLDMTRLVSRIGRGPWTGIDRVEFEYLRELQAGSVPLFVLVRTGWGYLIFDPAGAQKLLQRFSSVPPSRTSWLGRLFALGGMTRVARWRVSAHDLGTALANILPAGTAYLNVGHSNISAKVFTAVREISASRIAVMLHDTIPLDYPNFQRPGAAATFAAKLNVAVTSADLLICNSAQSERDLRRNSRVQISEIVVAHLGVKTAKSEASDLPEDVSLTPPYFVTIGTIEPRKNHKLLLDIWELFVARGERVHLFIVGQRGWNNQKVFKRLDQRPDNVTELNNLTDGAVVALLQGANGLLSPSHAEGFGLPVSEAAMLSVPVICSDLPVFHEVLGEYPIYADVADMYDWETKIQKLAHSGGKKNNTASRPRQEMSLPTWDDHFNIVLRLT